VTSVDVRRLRAADQPALAAAVARAREAGEFRASSDPDAAFFLQAFDYDPSIVGGAFSDGELLGFVSGEFKLVVVHPDRRREGHGRRLVDLAIEIERSRGRIVLILGRLPSDDAAGAFLRATGFDLHSLLWDLDLPRGVAVAEPVWPDGLAMRTFDRDRDIEPWVALFNVAFADHATPLQVDASFVTAAQDDPAIVDEDTGVLEELATGELVGFCATAPVRRDGTVEAAGEIWTIGVRPDRQGRGYGRQLLRWGSLRLRSIGALDVNLSVNGRNEHALQLYESEGFVRRQTRERWARPVALAPDAEAPR
jgi:mycothiol synthase